MAQLIGFTPLADDDQSPADTTGALVEFTPLGPEPSSPLRPGEAPTTFQSAAPAGPGQRMPGRAPMMTPPGTARGPRPFSEREFRSWYADRAARLGLDPDPDSQPYDYRAAFAAGAEPGPDGHWPSQFKKAGHPTEVVGGFDTRTGERVPGTPRASEQELVAQGWEPEAARRLAQSPEPGPSGMSRFMDGAKSLGTAVGGALEAAGEFGASLPRRLGTDPLVALGKGAIGLGEAVVGGVDLALAAQQAGKPTRKLSLGRALEGVGWNPAVAKAWLGEFYSDAEKEGEQAVNDAEGVVETAVAALSHPQVLFTSAVESLPSMLGGAGVGRGLKMAGLAADAAGALGEGAISAGAMAETVRQQNPDGVLTPGQAALSGAAGALVAGAGKLGAATAKTLGVVDLESAIAAAAADDRAMRGLVSQVLLGALQEGVVEELPQSIVEQAMQNLATGRPVAEGVDQAIVMGTLVGGMMGAGTQIGARVANRLGRAGAEGQGVPSNDPGSTPAVGAPSADSPDETLSTEPSVSPEPAEASIPPVPTPVSALPGQMRSDLLALGYDAGTVDALTLPEAQDILRGGPQPSAAPGGMASLAGATTDPDVRSQVMRDVENDPVLRAKRDEMMAAAATPFEANTPTDSLQNQEGPAPFDAADAMAEAVAPADVPTEAPAEMTEDERVDAIMRQLEAEAGGASVEVVDDEASATENASGESAASVEAQRRDQGMKARGERFMVYDRAGNGRPLIGPEAVDYTPSKGETYGIEGPDGFRVLEDNGGKVPSQSAQSADASIRERTQGLRPEVVERETGLPVDVRGQELDPEGTAPSAVTADPSWSQYRVGDQVRLEDGSTARVSAEAKSPFGGVQVERDGRTWTVRQEKLSRVETEEQSAPPTVEGVTIRRNAAKNSVEVKFKDKPDEAIRAQLKAAGFRWTKLGGGLWYSSKGNAWEVAHRATGRKLPSDVAMERIAAEDAVERAEAPADTVTYETKSLQTGQTSQLTLPKEPARAYRRGDRVDYRGEMHEVVVVSSTTPRMLYIKPNSGPARDVHADHVKPWPKTEAKPATPQVMEAPAGTSYVLPSFVTGGVVPAKSDKAAKFEALRAKRATAQAEIDAAVSGVKAALKKASTTLPTGIPLPPRDLVVQTVRLVNAYAKAGIVEVEEAWLLFQDDLGALAAQAKRAFEIAWQQTHGVAVTVTLDASATETRDGTDGIQSDDRGALAGAPAENGGASPSGGDAGAGGESGGAVDGGSLRGSAAEREAPGRSEGADLPGVGAAADGGRRPGARKRPGDVGRDEPRANYVIEPSDDVVPRGEVGKITANLAAIALLKKIEAESRPATAEEQDVLVRYTGWGGLASIFNSWDKRYHELREALTDDEYKAARASTPNAHYTSLPVIRAMWAAVEQLGFTGGRVLEPSMGVGHFFGAKPADLVARMAGVELDSITGRIAAVLYPQASVQVTGFEKAKLPDGFFDVAIGNVPFGNYPVADPAFRKADRRAMAGAIHNYFFAKALDKVRPGGLVAFITSRYTMDAKDSTVREYLAGQADLVGAIRLPRQAFKGNAGTEVVTDILFLRKRAEGEAAGSRAWVETEPLTIDGKTAQVNAYYSAHPEHVVGEASFSGSMYSDAELTYDYTGDDFDAALSTAVQSLPRDVMRAAPTPTSVTNTPTAKELIPAPDDVKTDAFTLKDGRVFVNVDGNLEPVSADPTTLARITGLIGVRSALRSTMRVMLDPASSDTDVAAAQKALGKAYDGFVKKHGYIGSDVNVRAFMNDPDRPLLETLEEWESGKDQPAKAKIFTTRTLAPVIPPTTADSPKAALVISLGWRGKVDLPYMAQLTGRSEEELTAELSGVLYRDPAGGWMTADRYLSGNVREKLAIARAAAAVDAAYDANVAALEGVQPADLTPQQITARLGASWIASKDVEDFVAHIIGRRSFKVSYAKPLAKWAFAKIGGRYGTDPNTSDNTAKWGTPRLSGHEIVLDTLNMKTITVTDVAKDGDTYKTVVNIDATNAAREKQEAIKAEFTRWLWDDDARAVRLVRAYNDTFNHSVEWKPDGSHLVLPGMSPLISLRPHQKNAIWRAIQSPTTGLGHVVGAGKTFEIIGAAMEMRRLGLAKKPMIVVPNHLVKQWAAEFRRMYPTANVLMATKKDFQGDNRRRLMSRIATGDWDAVVVAHRSYGLVPVSDETFAAYVEEQIAALEEAIAEEAQAGERKSPTVKELEKKKKALEAKLEKRRDVETQDKTVTFEELGVDAVFVDEAHLFKNLMLVTKMTRVAGLSTSASDRADDMFIKTRYTRGRGGRVVFATGTPVANTMAEVYTMMRYLQADELEAAGLAHFDAWAQNFGDTVTSFELSPEGSGMRLRTRFAQFTNLPELLLMFRGAWDILTAKQVKLPVPKIKGGAPRTIVSKPSAGLLALMPSLVARAEKIRAGKVKPTEDNMLAVTGDGRKAALDMRLLDHGYGRQGGNKIPDAVREIARIFKATTKVKGTQLVFSDLGTPATKGKKKKVANAGFSVYAEIRDQLVEAGVPRDQIAFIHDANTDDRKQALFDKVNAGEVRILLGSTEKMGAGTNVQRRLVGLHHIDAPWRPSDIEQREGRILRQGNALYEADPEGFEVEIFRYVTERSFDAYMWQTLESKARFIEQAMNGDVTMRNADDVGGGALTAAEVKALASGNPLVFEKVKADAELRRLESLQRAYLDAQWKARQERSYVQAWNASRERHIAVLESLKAAASTPEKFALTIGGQTFDNRDDADERLREVLAQAPPDKDVLKNVGGYAGLKIAVRRQEDARGNASNLLVLHAGPDAVIVPHQPTSRSVEHTVRTRIDEDLTAARTALKAEAERMAGIEAEVAKPFPHTEALAKAKAENERLGKALDLDAKSQQTAAAAVTEDEAKALTVEEESDDDTESTEREDDEGGTGGRASIGTYVVSKPAATVRMTPMGGALTVARPTADGLFPELVEFVRELTGTPGVVERFRKATTRGMFKSGKVLLRADLFTPENRGQLAAVIAHEIGHLVDWMPDFDDRRGNLLGHLRSLHRFMKHTYTSAADAKKVKNADVKAELLELSKAWRPFPSDFTASYEKYRNSPHELYADAISVLLNDPERLAREAPIFFKEFHAELDRKPEAKTAYLELLEALSRSPEELSARRQARVDRMFQLGDEKAIDLAILKREERKLARANAAMRLRIDYVDKNSAVIDAVKAVQARGVYVPVDDDPRYLLEEREHMGALGKVWVEEHVQPVQDALTKAEIGWHTFGKALFYERIITGDRSKVANPTGISAEEARTDYSAIVNALTPSQRTVLQNQLEAFRAGVKSIAEKAYQDGLFTDAQIKTVRENEFYATFQTIDHMADGLSSSIIKQVGTLKDVRNTADATILKTLVTLRAAEHNKVKRDALGWMAKHAPPGSVVPAKQVWDANAKAMTPSEPPRGSRLALIEWKEEGRWLGAWVDPFVAAAFSTKTSVGYQNALLQTLQWANGWIFRPVFTTYNVGFMAFNAGRDFLRFWKATPTMTLRRALLRYYEAVPMAAARAKVFGYRDRAKLTPKQLAVARKVLEAEKARILDVTLAEAMGVDDLEPTAIGQIMAEAGVQTYEAERSRLRRTLDWVRDVGDFVETLPKAAAIIELTSDGRTIDELDAAERSFIRRKVGSPDFKQGGRERAWLNNVFLYSNAILQGTRADRETATDPTTLWGYWVKTAALNVLPKLATFGLIAMAAGAGDDDDDSLGALLSGVSEYDLTNYLIVPMGRDANGKAIVMRVPQDDFGRLVGGLTWKLLGFLRGDRDLMQAVAHIVDYTAGQGPGVTPTLGLINDGVAFASGKNVYDDFRSRAIFTQEDMDAGMGARAGKFFRYEWNQAGGSIFWRLDESSRPDRKRSALEKALGAPVASNTIGRFLKVTDQGYREREMSARGKTRQAAATVNRVERSRVSDEAAAIRGMIPPERKRAIATAATRLAKEIHVDAPRDALKAQERDIKRKLTIAVALGDADIYVESLITSRTNAEKAGVLERAKSAMSPDRYRRWLALVEAEGIVSKNLLKGAKP